jgi:hypothetical protein
MKRTSTIGWIFAALLLVLNTSMRPPASLAAGSLYDRYTTASRESLEKETVDMLGGLKKTFRYEDIGLKERRIDLADYAAHLEKAAVYASRLAAYSNKEEDLRFARENELFQGLPDETEDPEQRRIRKDFVETKFERMNQNVEEEISTYKDMILICIEECEAKMDGDLGAAAGDEAVVRAMQRHLAGKAFQDYARIRGSIRETWPELERRLALQISLWSLPGADPEAPIISTSITGAL